ncbi:MAG: hypothetical protein GXN92_00285 [Candidatus Micrarchaeota archaeon]|nr:hypothetical protein [Candidatus Micrarchaeota archaeon]
MISTWIRALERLFNLFFSFLLEHLDRFDAGLKAAHVLPHIQKYSRIYTDIPLLKEYIPKEKQSSFEEAEFVISERYTTKPGVYFSQEGSWSNILVRKHGKEFELLFFLLIATIGMGYLLQDHTPLDDLNRHLKAWQYSSYKELYPFTTWMFSFNPYWLWDNLLGWLYQQLGDFSHRLVQLGAFFLMLEVFRRVHEHLPMREWPLLLLIWLYFLSLNITLARPSFYMSMLSLIIYLGGGLLWKLLWTLMGLGYYVWWIYLPLVLHRKHMLWLSLFLLVFWIGYTDGTYFQELATFFSLVWERGLHNILENKAWFYYIGDPLVLMMLGAWLISKKRYLWGTIYSMLLYQIRYFQQLTIPLMMGSISPRLKFLFSWIPWEIMYGVVVIVMFSYFMPSHNFLYDFGNISLDNKTLLASNMGIMYQILHKYDYVRIAPAMELGLNVPEVNAFLANKTLDCGFAQQFDYVISDVPLNESCLQLTYATKDLFFYVPVNE